MNIALKRISRFFLLTLVLSCDENEEARCDSYFLTQEKIGTITTQFHYNPNGLIDSLVFTGNYSHSRAEFYYDSEQRLTAVIDSHGKTEFYFDNKDRLIATAKHNARGEFVDSLYFEYDNSDRIIKRSIYTDRYPRPYLQTFYQVEYTSTETITVKFYERADVFNEIFNPGSTFIYTLDSNPKPFSESYSLLYLSWGNVLLPHNELSLSIFRDGKLLSTQTYEYRYNAGGFPVQKGDHRYSYTCEPL